MDAPIRTDMHDAQGNLTRPWVLFLQSVGSSTSAGGYSLIGVSGGSATPDLGAGKMLEILLTIATTAIASPVNGGAGDSFKLLLQQDATGGRAVTFSTDYIGIDPTGFDTTASTFIVMEFSTRDGKSWYKTSGPTAPLKLS